MANIAVLPGASFNENKHTSKVLYVKEFNDFKGMKYYHVMFANGQAGALIRSRWLPCSVEVGKSYTYSRFLNKRGSVVLKIITPKTKK